MTPRVYLDAVVVIYLVEQNPLFAPAVGAALVKLGGVLISSELARMEALVHPVRHNDAQRVLLFEAFFQSAVAQLRPVNRPVFDLAVQFRATHGWLKPADAIHLAAAVESGCDVFLTNDHRLNQFTGIRVEVI